MKKITYKNVLELLKSKALIALVGGSVLTSCGAAMGGYSETDGVYYDPNRDTIPEGTVMNEGNRVGEYYDYQAEDSGNKYLNAQNRNKSWQEDQNSDWGNFTGTETYYTDSWGDPFGYSPFGFGLSIGWGLGGYYSPWGFGYQPFGGFYSPYYGYYNPYYGYNPYYYNPYGYYSPYYGHYPPYVHGYNSYYAPRFEYKRSGASGNGFRSGSSGREVQNNRNTGFRNEGQRQNSNQISQPRYNAPRQSNEPRYRSQPQQQTMPRQQSMPRQTPTYEQPRRSSSESSIRSGGFNSGSTGTTTGSTRSSGGFRR